MSSLGVGGGFWSVWYVNGYEKVWICLIFCWKLVYYVSGINWIVRMIF